MAPSKIIIDTDPGCDDTLAMLLALSAKSEELDVPLISLTFGNVEVRNCLRNVITLFHTIEKELNWRKENNQPEGFETMKSSKPIVAVGAEQPLEDQLLLADYFHGIDGLAGIHSSHPHLTPEPTWERLFQPSTSEEPAVESETQLRQAAAAHEKWFRPSLTQAHKETLRLLRENEPDTISILAMGPLTNLAMAAAEDPETFLRVKEVIVMGGAIDIEGNATPVGEFNTFADAVAAARVFALTSDRPLSTFPPPPPPSATGPGRNYPPPYPAHLSRRLRLTLIPLDITTRHLLRRGAFNAKALPLLRAGSPLAEWMTAFMTSIFDKMDSLHPGPEGDASALSLHDPMTVWYAMTRDSPAWIRSPDGPEDIRVETAGQWTRGMCVVDRRSYKPRVDEEEGEIPGDIGNWRGKMAGNKVDRIVGSPGEDVFEGYLLERVLG